MVLMRADTHVGKWGGGELALEISSFVGPCEIARTDRCIGGFMNTRIQCCGSGIRCIFYPGSGIWNRIFYGSRIPNPYF